MDYLRKVKDWLSGKKTYLVGLALAIGGIAGMDVEAAKAGAFVDSLLSILSNTEFLVGLATMTMRAAITKAGNGNGGG